MWILIMDMKACIIEHVCVPDSNKLNLTIEFKYLTIRVHMTIGATFGHKLGSSYVKLPTTLCTIISQKCLVFYFIILFGFVNLVHLANYIFYFYIHFIHLIRMFYTFV